MPNRWSPGCNCCEEVSLPPCPNCEEGSVVGPYARVTIAGVVGEYSELNGQWSVQRIAGQWPGVDCDWADSHVIDFGGLVGPQTVSFEFDANGTTNYFLCRVGVQAFEANWEITDTFQCGGPFPLLIPLINSTIPGADAATLTLDGLQFTS